MPPTKIFLLLMLPSPATALFGSILLPKIMWFLCCSTCGCQGDDDDDGDNDDDSGGDDGGLYVINV